MTRDRDSTHVDTVGEISTMVAANLDLLPEPSLGLPLRRPPDRRDRLSMMDRARIGTSR
jgi:hypothetical protein